MIKQNAFLFAAAIMAVSSVSAVSAFNLDSLQPTGVDTNSDGVDDFYTLDLATVAGGGSGTPYIVGAGQPEPWLDDSLSLGKWIGPTAERLGDTGSAYLARDGGRRVSNSPETPDPTAESDYYRYTLNFNLGGTSDEFRDNFAIFGQWSSDNGSFIQLNDGPTSSTTSAGGFGDLTDFNFDDGFILGENKLVFYVSNESSPNPRVSSPTGLLVASISAVPEPTTIMGLALGGLMAGFVGYRRRKAVAGV